ncbi:GNAT family N-acetyltransferase [Paenibacillus wynnii]|uniref:GNAT family N-acetyltransferase n=1 Tax=Paenibacillus wynnii TaxID=268407 RepID=UPI00279358D1|nr:GNAT family N-acetyltransferase [Paenibacillus wynnii]MDQ0194089.1 ribosomal protein S18 acetylase RimI-like enzyme [Paenibacillus wynnii]
MNTNITLTLVESLDAELEQSLSHLLISVVEDGASIGFLPPLDLEEAHQYWQNVIQPGTMLWIAKEKDMIVGTVQLHLASKANARHRAEIAKLMVHPEHRRKGIAGLLMVTAEAAAVSEARELIVLDTREGDPSNILYQSLGYIEGGRIPYYARSANGELHATVFYYKKL